MNPCLFIHYYHYLYQKKLWFELLEYLNHSVHSVSHTKSHRILHPNPLLWIIQWYHYFKMKSLMIHLRFLLNCQLSPPHFPLSIHCNHYLKIILLMWLFYLFLDFLLLNQDLAALINTISHWHYYPNYI